ncbi:DNA topoisomerase-1 [Acetoanaerobium pronyense]|uniref:DNA topoisomerase 1 n=1 Tax=Acetoanaerobium pronyense TaxID=1482736 RepID=A0ABS4KJ71_9FIRM|nr:type I DNA topoisomerase [Acetoanaerobium pronyense]MBP2027804.1 DNA topoisomerase-1 [Acetoanaerobium pronyense]
MGKNLVIVESPAKAKTIGKFLGKNYIVKASVGHIRDLPKSKMGVDVENDFEPQYITIRGKGPVVNEIKKEAKKADKVYLATDPDREGEAISWHLAYLLGLDEKENIRIEFNEITKEAIKKAIKNPRKIDINLVDAQQGRRVLDRLVGYKISPILWAKIRKGLSAGRVQSVTTKLVCDREKEIEAFEPEEYWSLNLKAKTKEKKTIDFKFFGNTDGKMDIKTNEQVEEILRKIEKKDLEIEKIETKERKRSSQKPFTTSLLQQDAANRLSYATKKTMMIAQQLYEGIDIKGKGTTGLVTYIRTDSQRISDEAQEQGKDFIKEKYGEKYYKPYVNASKKNKKVQDAHECIRPTSISLTPETIKDSLSKDQYKLYKLIWDRFTASMMSDALYDSQTITGKVDEYTFKASGSKMKFDGFTKVYNYSAQEEVILPTVEEGEKLKVSKLEPKQHFTQPPPRYSEASLVKTLEERGIGRPSTYSPTISTILQRGYVSKKGNVLYPTELGFIVTEIMEENFDKFVDVDFTAEMEGKLDKVEDGDIRWQDIISELYNPLENAVEKAVENIEKIVLEEETDEICDICGSSMVVKFGRFGKFLACKNYPECKGTKPMLEKIGVKCPECEDGEVILRKSKKGRVFYGCSKFPNCKFVSWDRPVGENCPKCDSILVSVKNKSGEKIKCSNKECDYEKE